MMPYHLDPAYQAMQMQMQQSMQQSQNQAMNPTYNQSNNQAMHPTYIPPGNSVMAPTYHPSMNPMDQSVNPYYQSMGPPSMVGRSSPPTNPASNPSSNRSSEKRKSSRSHHSSSSRPITQPANFQPYGQSMDPTMSQHTIQQLPNIQQQQYYQPSDQQMAPTSHLPTYNQPLYFPTHQPHPEMMNQPFHQGMNPSMNPMYNPNNPQTTQQMYPPFSSFNQSVNQSHTQSNYAAPNQPSIQPPLPYYPSSMYPSNSQPSNAGINPSLNPTISQHPDHPTPLQFHPTMNQSADQQTVPLANQSIYQQSSNPAIIQSFGALANPLLNPLVNRPTDQSRSVTPSIGSPQSINQSNIQTIKRPNTRLTIQTNIQSADQSSVDDRSASHSVNQSISRPNLSVDISDNQSTASLDQSVNQSINHQNSHPLSRTINRSISHSVSQVIMGTSHPIDQAVARLMVENAYDFHHYLSFFMVGSSINQFREIAQKWVARGGVRRIFWWILRCWAAYQRDIQPISPNDDPAIHQSNPLSDGISTSLVKPLLINCLIVWYRLINLSVHPSMNSAIGQSTSQPNNEIAMQLSVNRSMNQAKILPILISLSRHYDPDMRDLAQAIYQSINQSSNQTHSQSNGHSNSHSNDAMNQTVTDRIRNDVQAISQSSAHYINRLINPSNHQTGGFTDRDIDLAIKQSIEYILCLGSFTTESINQSIHPSIEPTLDPSIDPYNQSFDQVIGRTISRSVDPSTDATINQRPRSMQPSLILSNEESKTESVEEKPVEQVVERPITRPGKRKFIDSRPSKIEVSRNHSFNQTTNYLAVQPADPSSPAPAVAHNQSIDQSINQSNNPPSRPLYPASIVCPVCNEISQNEVLNGEHVRHVHDQYFCSQCDLSFPAEDPLLDHFNTHECSGEGILATFACGLCGVAFLVEESLVNHQNNHLINQLLDEQSNEKSQSINQTSDETDEKQPVRDSSLSNRSSNNQSNNQLTDSRAIPWWTDYGPYLFTCEHPSHHYRLLFGSQVDLQSHLINQHGQYQCFHMQCTANNQSNNQSIFSSHESFQQHLASHVIQQVDEQRQTRQSNNQRSPPAQLSEHCHFCGQIFYNMTQKTEHLHLHQRPFVCSICPARFASKEAQQKHSEQHQSNDQPTNGHLDDDEDNYSKRQRIKK